MMGFDLKSPCKDCPFRADGKGIKYLHKNRIETICESLKENLFQCHKTINHESDLDSTPKRVEQHCAGALLFAEKQGYENPVIQYAEEEGLYEPKKLKRNVPVYDTVQDMINAQTCHE